MTLEAIKGRAQHWFFLLCLVPGTGFAQNEPTPPAGNTASSTVLEPEAEVNLEQAVFAAERDAQIFVSKGLWLDAVNAFEKAYSIGTNPKYLLAVSRIYDRMPDRCQWALLAWNRFIQACETSPEHFICDEHAEAVRRKIALEAFCPQMQRHLLVEVTRPVEYHDRPPWNVGTSLGSGVVISEWPVARVVPNTELVMRYDASVMGWNQPFGLAFELSYWRALEAPRASIVRLGLAGAEALTVRGGIQAVVDPATYVSMYCGMGLRHDLTRYLKLISEVDLSFWTVRPVIVPLEVRLGVSYGF